MASHCLESLMNNCTTKGRGNFMVKLHFISELQVQKQLLELHGSYRPETFLFKYFLRTFQGQITFFQGLFFHWIDIPGTQQNSLCTRPIRLGHFRVHLSLYFKARLSAKSLLWKSVFTHIEIRTNYHNKSFALRLALKERLRGTRKWPIVGDEGYCNTLSLEGTVPKVH